MTICDDCVHENKAPWIEPCDKCYLEDDKPYYRRDKGKLQTK